MSHNSFGHLFRVTTWGESHGPAIGCVVDGCPPRLPLSEDDIQPFLDRRRPGQSKLVTQRQEPDTVRILSGVHEGLTTGTPIALVIENQDQRSRDYGEIKDRFRPGHADLAYELKYGIRDHRGGGRSSARETAMRVAAGAVARKALGPDVRVNAVAPGLVDTDWTADWDAVRALVQAAAPLRRSATPDDVAEVVMGLVRSTYVTGQVVVVDGGLGCVS